MDHTGLPDLEIIEVADQSTLDSYLATLGPIQSLPTPPYEMSLSIMNSESNAACQDPKVLTGVARRLSLMTCYATDSEPIEISTIIAYLQRLNGTVQSIALTYNILANYQVAWPYRKRHDSAGPTVDTPLVSDNEKAPQSELVFIAALRLASCFLNERQDPMSWWIEAVARDLYSEEDLLKTTSEMFASIGWRLPIFASSDSIRSAMSSLHLASSPNKRSFSLPNAYNASFLTPTSSSPSPYDRRPSLVEPVSPFADRASYFDD